ncbi:MAG: hypothetical protein WCJ64_14600, partial [Rhodospirillaceae bacterium]
CQTATVTPAEPGDYLFYLAGQEYLKYATLTIVQYIVVNGAIDSVHHLVFLVHSLHPKYIFKQPIIQIVTVASFDVLNTYSTLFRYIINTVTLNKSS